MQNTSRATEDQQGVRGTLVEVYEPHNQATSQWYVTYMYVNCRRIGASCCSMAGYRRVEPGYRGILHKDSQLIIATLVAKSSLVPAANPAFVELVSTLLQTPERISKTRAIVVVLYNIIVDN